MSRARFSVWEDKQEQWLADHIEEPLWVGVAITPAHAAEMAAEGDPRGGTEYIVRRESDNQYWLIEISKQYVLKQALPVTLAELCGP